MNISLQNMLAVKSSEKPNPAADINYHCNVNFDKVTFDSLINNFRAEKPSGTLEQSSYSAERNEQRYAERAEEIKRRQDRPDEFNEVDEQDSNERYEQVDTRPDKTENNEYTNAPQDNAVREIEQEKNTDNPEQIDGSGTVVVEKNTELSDETELNKDNGVKAGVFLSAMANNFKDGMTDEIETVQSAVKVQSSEKSADGGIKTVVPLFRTEEGIVQADNNIKAEDGLKAGILLKDMIKSNSPVNTETKTTPVMDTENAEVFKNEQPKSEKGLKAGTHLFDRVNSNINEKTINDGLINAQIKAPGTAAEDIQAAGKNTLKTVRENGNTKQNIVNEFKVQGETAGADIIEENNIARTFSGRGMSEFAANFARQGGSRNVNGNSSKAMHVNTENNNSIASSSTITAETGKTNEGLNVARAARPSAFQEIAEKIIYSIKGHNRIGVTIEHETLGKLNMNLNMNKGIVNVHINVADSATRELVENNINNIIETLSKNGVSVGGFSVGLKNQKNNENGYGRNENGNKNDFAIEERKESDYTKAGMYMRRNDGLVSVFA